MGISLKIQPKSLAGSFRGVGIVDRLKASIRIVEIWTRPEPVPAISDGLPVRDSDPVTRGKPTLAVGHGTKVMYFAP